MRVDTQTLEILASTESLADAMEVLLERRLEAQAAPVLPPGCHGDMYTTRRVMTLAEAQAHEQACNLR